MKLALSLYGIPLCVAGCFAPAQVPHPQPHADVATSRGPTSVGSEAAQEPEQDPPVHEPEWAEERALVEQARGALERSVYPAAREFAARAIDSLLSSTQRGENWLDLLNGAGQAAWDAQDAGSAKRAWGEVLEIRSRTLPAEDPDLQGARASLALAIKALGDLAGARFLEEAVLDVYSRTLPADHPRLQRARLNLAATMYALGDLARARTLFEAALEGLSRTLPADHPDLQVARGNLAATIKVLGDLPGARALEEAVLEVRSRTLPADHPALQAARGNLALTIKALGDLHGARSLEEAVLEARSRTLPADHPELQAARLNLAATIGALGDLAGARALEEAVLEVRTRTLPADHPRLQMARLNLAATTKALGDLQGARALEEAALEGLSRTLPAEHPDLQAARLNLAETIKALGDLAGARFLEEAVLEVRSRTLPADHPDLHRARLNLAWTIRELGDLHGARLLEEAALEGLTRTLPSDHPDLQAARMNLAATIGALGDLVGARGLLETVLEVRSRTLPADHPDLQAARGNLAATIQALGDLHGARALEEAVLAARSRSLPAGHPSLQAARLNLAGTLHALGDLAGARALFEAVLEVFSRTLPADHPDLQSARGNLAATLRALGDLAGARALEEAVLEVRLRTYPEDHPALQAARTNLAATMGALGDLSGARALLEAVLEVFSRTLPVEHPKLQMARLNLASTLKALGDLGGARALEEAVLDVLSRTLPADHPGLQAARGNLAATIAAQAARAMRCGRGGGEGRGESEGVRERCVELLGAIARSRAHAVREAIFTSSRREAEERAARLGEELDLCLSFTVGYGALGATRELLADTFTLSESTRGAALASAALARKSAGSVGFEGLRARLRECANELAALAQRGATSRELQDSVARRDALERELIASVDDALGDEEWLELEALAISTRLEPDQVAVAYRRFNRRDVTFAGDAEEPELARPLEESTESLCAFVLLPGATDSKSLEERLILVEFGPLAPIEDAVSAWRAALGASEGRGLGIETLGAASDLEERGEALRARVFDPLLPALGDARRVVLVLDDVLHLVPFEALPARREGAEGLELLGERYRFELRATLTELLLAARDEPAGALLALGGAAFGGEPLGLGTVEVALAAVTPPADGLRPVLLRESAWERGFAPLAYTALEVRGLSNLYDEGPGEREVFLLEGAHASRASLVELAPRARWLHVATHGWYASESVRSWQDPEPLDAQMGLGMRQSGEEQIRGSSPMLLCGLALAGANLPPDALGCVPGLVTAEELSTLDLTGCELAVLSACDTNVGQRRAGQGVASLQKALHMAGAKSVITSLWKVPDEATSELMLDFYRRLWVEDKPKHQALWEAKMRLRRAQDERGNPLYTTRDWAAWVLTGEPD